MDKRLLPAALAAALVFQTLPAVSAASKTSADEMAQVLSALDIMTGDEQGNLFLSREVTRAEFTKLTIAASPLADGVGASTTVSPYPDVPYTHWAAPYVEAAVAAGYINGYLDGTFHPDEDITLAMGVTMVLRLLGYQDSDFAGAWPSGQMTLYRNLDLDEGISVSETEAMTRQDAMYLFYNLLTAKTKTGQVYLTTLGHSLTPDGEIDRVALINSAMEGPVILRDGWRSQINFDVTTAKVFRGGSASTLSALQTNDVIYYSKSMRTLWAYTNKVTGRYQAVSPTASSPTAVTVAGKTYALETPGAAYDVSNLGPYQVGDTITLLLGRNGGAAAVAAPENIAGNFCGIVTSVTDDEYTDTNGHSYTAKTVLVTTTDGNTYSYPVETKSDWEAGDLVQVVAGGGKTEVTRLKTVSVTGKINSSATRLGNTLLADDVQILDVDVNTGAAVRIYPSRLAGMKLTSGQVKYYHEDAEGIIDRLILNNATGDLASYGVMISAKETDNGLYAVGSYEFDVGGVTYPYVMTNGVLNQSIGPVKIEGPLQAPKKFTKLTSVKLSAVDAQNALTASLDTFPIWENVVVYETEGGKYQISSLERVRSGYTLTGWYDKSVSAGGRIRVIIAKASNR